MCNCDKSVNTRTSWEQETVLLEAKVSGRDSSVTAGFIFMSCHKLFWTKTPDAIPSLLPETPSALGLHWDIDLDCNPGMKVVAWIYTYTYPGEGLNLVYLWVNGAYILLVCVFLTLPAISGSFLTLSPGMNAQHTLMSLKSPKANTTFLVKHVLTHFYK